MRIFRYILASLLILSGVGLLLITPIQNYLVQRQSDSHLDVSATEIETNQSTEVTYDFLDIDEVSLTDVLNAQQDDSDLPVIGSIIIPDVNLHLPIIKGVSHRNMLAGAGTMKEDIVMGEGNYPLASHNMKDRSLLFSPLHRSEIGMSIFLTDMEHVFEYTIHTRDIIEPTRMGVIAQTDEATVTLITCNYNGERRLLVQGVLVETTTVEENETLQDWLSGQ